MQNKLPIGLVTGGLLLIIVTALMGWVGVPKIVEHFVKKEFQLREGTEVLDMWADPPFPITMSVYIFNVTNPNEVEAGEMPNLVEVGPYIYKETRIKEQLTHNDPENPKGTIQYKERKTWYWVPDETPGTKDQEDKVNVINIPFVSLVHAVQEMAPFLAPFLANYILRTETFIRKNIRVGDLLFDGFDVSNITESWFLGPILLQTPQFANGRFGMYRTENHSLTKEYDIYTGVDDNDRIGEVRKFDGDFYLNFWKPNSICDKVRGGDGSIFPPFVKKDKEFAMFGGGEVCRSLTISFGSEEDFKGIKVYRFIVPRKALEDPRINKENQCFCLKDTLDQCQKAGVMNLDGCQPGANVLMSFPYFWNGDDDYRKGTGLPAPEKEKHETYLDIEPTIGAVIRANKRMQVNFDVRVGNGIIAYRNLTNVVFPLLWVDENAEIDDDYISDLKSRFLTPMKIISIGKWVLLGVGLVIVAIGLGIFYRRRKAQKNMLELKTDE